MKSTSLKKMPLWESLLLFGVPSLYFFLLTRFFTPFFTNQLHFHPSLSWYITGYFVFIPLFLGAILFVKKEQAQLTVSSLCHRLRLRPLSKRDLRWTILATITSFIGMGIVWGIFSFLTLHFNFPPLETTPPFMSAKPLFGKEKLYLLIWFPMFFFNIVGEQMLWQGYILPRQELTYGKWAWIANGLCWMLFHLCFGKDLVLLLLPLLLIIPFTIQKTQNTTTGLLVHAIVNGPMAVLVALGFMG